MAGWPARRLAQGLVLLCVGLLLWEGAAISDSAEDVVLGDGKDMRAGYRAKYDAAHLSHAMASLDKEMAELKFYKHNSTGSPAAAASGAQAAAAAGAEAAKQGEVSKAELDMLKAEHTHAEEQAVIANSSLDEAFPVMVAADEENTNSTEDMMQARLDLRVKRLDAQILAANSASLDRQAALERRAVDANVSTFDLTEEEKETKRLESHREEVQKLQVEHGLTKSEASRKHAVLTALEASKTNLDLLLSDNEIEHLTAQLKDGGKHLTWLKAAKDNATKQMETETILAAARLKAAQGNLSADEAASAQLGKQYRDNTTAASDAAAKAAASMAETSAALERAGPALKRYQDAQAAAGKDRELITAASTEQKVADEEASEMNEEFSHANKKKLKVEAESEMKVDQYNEARATLDDANVKERQVHVDAEDTATRLAAEEVKLATDEEKLKAAKSKYLSRAEIASGVSAHLQQLKLKLLQAIKGDKSTESADWTPESEEAMSWTQVEGMINNVTVNLDNMQEKTTQEWRQTNTRKNLMKGDIAVMEKKVQKEDLKLQASENALANVTSQAEQAAMASERAQNYAKTETKAAAESAADASSAEAAVVNGLEKANAAQSDEVAAQGEIAAIREHIQTIEEEQLGDGEKRRRLRAELAALQTEHGMAMKALAKAEAEAEALYDDEDHEDSQRADMVGTLAKAQYTEHRAAKAVHEAQKKIAAIDAEKVSLVMKEKRQRAALRGADAEDNDAQTREKKAEDQNSELRKREEAARSEAAQLANVANEAKLSARKAVDMSLQEEEYKVAAEQDMNAIKEKVNEDKELLAQEENQFSTLVDSAREGNITLDKLGSKARQVAQEQAASRAAITSYEEAKSATSVAKGKMKTDEAMVSAVDATVAELKGESHLDDVRLANVTRAVKRSKAATDVLYEEVQSEGAMLDDARTAAKAVQKEQRQAVAAAAAAKEKTEQARENARLALKEEFEADRDSKGARDRIEAMQDKGRAATRRMDSSKVLAEQAQKAYSQAADRTAMAKKTVGAIEEQNKDEHETLVHQLSIEGAEYNLARLQNEEIERRLKDRKETIALATQRVNETTAALANIDAAITVAVTDREAKQQAALEKATVNDVLNKYEEADEDKARANRTLTQIRDSVKATEAAATARMSAAKMKVQAASAAAFAAAQWNTKAEVAKHRYESMLKGKSKESHGKSVEKQEQDEIFASLLKKGVEQQEQAASDEKKSKKEAKGRNDHELQMARSFMDATVLQKEESEGAAPQPEIQLVDVTLMQE